MHGAGGSGEKEGEACVSEFTKGTERASSCMLVASLRNLIPSHKYLCHVIISFFLASSHLFFFFTVYIMHEIKQIKHIQEHVRERGEGRGLN